MMIQGRGGKKGGTFSGRQKGMRAMPPFMMYGGPPGPPGPPMMPPGLPPHLMPPPGHPLFDAEAQAKFEQFKELASSLHQWIREHTTIMQVSLSYSLVKK